MIDDIALAQLPQVKRKAWGIPIAVCEAFIKCCRECNNGKVARKFRKRNVGTVYGAIYMLLTVPLPEDMLFGTVTHLVCVVDSFSRAIAVRPVDVGSAGYNCCAVVATLVSRMGFPASWIIGAT